jgi:type IV pilus assembly protein PilV
MLEVLVSLAITAFGLFGLVGLQAVAQKMELESYQRAQALILLSDIIDRINTNRAAASCYVVTTTASSSGSSSNLGTTGTGHYDVAGFSCGALASNPAAVARAQLDLTEIDNALQGAAEKLAGGQVGAMIGARACIGFDSNTRAYTVAVAWQGITPTFSPAGWTSAPATARYCAVDQYGADTQRRVVWNSLIVASLI